MKETDTKCRQVSQGLILLLVILWAQANGGVDAALAKADSQCLFQSCRLPIQCSVTTGYPCSSAQVPGTTGYPSSSAQVPMPAARSRGSSVCRLMASRPLAYYIHGGSKSAILHLPLGRCMVSGGRNVEANQLLVFQLGLLSSML